jgi:hypothetical protein
MHDVVERLQVLEFRLYPVRPTHHLATEPPGSLRERSRLVPNQHHDVLGLLGEVSHPLQGTGDVILKSVDQCSQLLRLVRYPEHRHRHRDGHAQKGQRQDCQRDGDRRANPVGSRTDLYQCQCQHISYLPRSTPRMGPHTTG